MQYCIDMFSGYKKWMDDYDIKTKNGPNGQYLSVVVDEKEKKKIVKKIVKSKVKYRCYEKRWERGSDYRKKFFEYYNPPYRCRYCNKPLTKNSMVIDHIIPISQVKKNTNARMKLYVRGISEVNDVRNLAPSCYKCNEKKGSKIGLWYWRALLGKYKAYWIIKKILFVSIIAVCAYFLYTSNINPIFK